MADGTILLGDWFYVAAWDWDNGGSIVKQDEIAAEAMRDDLWVSVDTWGEEVSDLYAMRDKSSFYRHLATSQRAGQQWMLDGPRLMETRYYDYESAIFDVPGSIYHWETTLALYAVAEGAHADRPDRILRLPLADSGFGPIWLSPEGDRLVGVLDHMFTQTPHQPVAVAIDLDANKAVGLVTRGSNPVNKLTYLGAGGRFVAWTDVEAGAWQYSPNYRDELHFYGPFGTDAE